MPIALFALALAAFAVGTAEFIIAGLLPTLAHDLSVDIPTAGLLVSVYALAVAFGGPVLALLTAHWARKPMIVALIALFGLGQVLCALAPNYPLLLAARVLVALTHGLFFGNATIAAAGLVPADKRASAIAIVLAGVPLANLLGVPIGAELGHWLGWRAAFWCIGGLAALAVIAVVIFLPAAESGSAEPPVRWRAQIGILFRHEIALSYLALMVLLAGALAFVTFQVPFLVNVTGIPEASTPPFLFAFGGGAIIGIFAGGRLSDWKLMPSFVGATLFFSAVAATILLTMHDGTAMLVVMALLGIGFYTFTVPPQARIVGASAGAETLAATFIATAFNLGYAIGALAGAGLLAGGFGYPSLPVAAIVCGLAATAISLWSWRLDRA